MSLYNEKIEHLINAALADGELTEKEKQILFRKAEAEGIDLDEFEMVLEARLYEVTQAAAEKAAAEKAQIAAQQAQVAAAQAAAAQAAAAQAAAQQSAAPKSQKFGDIRKCPACGAIVATGSATCTECGYAFNEDSGTTAMDKLYERLAAIDKKWAEKSQASKIIGMFAGQVEHVQKPQEKLTAIRMFNVPNTRAELLGLLTSLQPLADPKGPKHGANMSGTIENLSLGYWDLFVNCINKAKISFANDKAFEPYFNYYNEKTAKKGLFGGLFGK